MPGLSSCRTCPRLLESVHFGFGGRDFSLSAVAPRAMPGKARIDLSVVVPAYNEAKRIERALEYTSTYLQSRGGSWELIVVDDGSADETALIIQRFIASRPAAESQVRLVRFDRNRGKGAALRAGVAATTGERVLMMD